MRPDHELADQGTSGSGAACKMVMQMMDLWQLKTEQQAALLGLESTNRRMLARYRKGAPAGLVGDRLERIRHLLTIHKNLRLLFPQDRELAYRWMTTRNRAFENLQPVEVIQEWGFTGMLMVRAYLDGAVGDAETTTADSVADEQMPRALGRRVYSTKCLPQDLREAIKASVAPVWTMAFNHEVKS